MREALYHHSIKSDSTLIEINEWRYNILFPPYAKKRELHHVFFMTTFGNTFLRNSLRNPTLKLL